MQNKLNEINYWKYNISDGFIVLAGKTAGDNEALSLKIAKPNDFWFHVSGDSGSHIILHHPDGDKPPKDIIKTAASIAAWHSKSRSSKNVFVTYSLAKFVRKMKGTPKGTVYVKNSKKIKIKPCLKFSN